MHSFFMNHLDGIILFKNILWIFSTTATYKAKQIGISKKVKT